MLDYKICSILRNGKMFPKMKAMPYIRARYIYPKGNYVPKIGFLEHLYYKNQLNYRYTFDF